jgi:hypothetical protein
MKRYLFAIVAIMSLSGTAHALTVTPELLKVMNGGSWTYGTKFEDITDEGNCPVEKCYETLLEGNTDVDEIQMRVGVSSWPAWDSCWYYDLAEGNWARADSGCKDYTNNGKHTWWYERADVDGDDYFNKQWMAAYGYKETSSSEKKFIWVKCPKIVVVL